LREICPRKKCTPQIGADIGAITGILLKFHQIINSTTQQVNSVGGSSIP
jgi:hypothetical protein